MDVLAGVEDDEHTPVESDAIHKQGRPQAKSGEFPDHSKQERECPPIHTKIRQFDPNIQQAIESSPWSRAGEKQLRNRLTSVPKTFLSMIQDKRI